jgi:hypothetical protein
VHPGKENLKLHPLRVVGWWKGKICSRGGYEMVSMVREGEEATKNTEAVRV